MDFTFLKKNKNLRALVVGDVMLDKYIYGNTSRISPEAPVPVVRINNEKFVQEGLGMLH